MGNDGLDDPVDPEFGGPSVRGALAFEDRWADLEVGIGRPGRDGPVVEGRMAGSGVHGPGPGAQWRSAQVFAPYRSGGDECVVATVCEIPDGRWGIGCQLDPDLGRFGVDVSKEDGTRGAMKSGAASRKVRLDVAGLNGSGGSIVRATWRRSLGSVSAKLSARTVGRIRRPSRRRSSSSSSSRSRLSAWLTADGVRSSRSAGAGDALLAEERIEHDQQIEVDIPKLNHVHLL